MNQRRGTRTWMAGTLAAVLLLAACGSDGGLTIDDAWGRTSPSAAANGAFYMTIGNDTGQADVLESVSTDACGTVELHQTTMEDDVMRMSPVEGGIEIPAHGEAVLEPGGFHVMCLDKQVAFDEGVTVDVTLHFAVAGDRTVEAEIRSE